MWQKGKWKQQTYTYSVWFYQNSLLYIANVKIQVDKETRVVP